MTDEERQRQMDFIVNTLARVSTRLDVLTEKVDGLANAQAQTEQERKASELERKADAVRISRLEDAFLAFSKLSERIYERLEDHQSRIADVEGAILILTKLLNRGSNGTS